MIPDMTSDGSHVTCDCPKQQFFDMSKQHQGHVQSMSKTYLVSLTKMTLASAASMKPYHPEVTTLQNGRDPVAHTMLFDTPGHA